tara:strand:+ start:129 stop:599 length:471 start_codon:yes stop_codon:yes gene_type:complete
MPSKSIFFMAALTLIILLAALYLGYELTETRKKNQVLIQQLLKSENNVGTGERQESFLKGAVKNTIVKNAQSIQSCFLKLIESTPDIPESGRVLVDWQIDSKGKVFEAGVVSDEFSNKEFQACLREKIGEIIFPAPPSVRPVYVEHTFLFRKEDKK